MNLSIIIYFVGWILNLESLIMVVPCLTALIYKEEQGLTFLIVALICAILGFIATHKKPSNTMFFAKEGFVSVALSWIALSFFGGLPFYLSGEIPRFEDAMFEVVSGFTTTGATILPNVEALSHCMMMWRSFTHWIGGMGILVFILAILPFTGNYNMHIMRAESPGPSVGKLVPRIKATAKILYIIYFFMTTLQIILLLLGRMPFFDAIAISFGTAGTGGFGIKANSIEFYNSYYLQTIIMIFMILFGINFNLYYLFLIKKPKDALCSEEARVYLGMILVSSLIIAWNIRGMFSGFMESFHHALFQVSSIITTTGYSTMDFNLWPELSKTILMLLMFTGACAGSTSGGVKISRLLIAVKSMQKDLAALIHPRSVKVLKLENKIIDQTVMRSMSAYFIAYSIMFVISLLLISLDNFDFSTNFTAIISALNNAGSGFSKIGPRHSFVEFSARSKYIMMFDMLAGRLEIFPMILLFSPSTWKSR